METDELDNLFVDENEPADKRLIATIIKPFIISIGRNGVIEFSDKFDDLPAWKKILVYLVCKKAMLLKEVSKEESAGPKEICEITNISEGSAKDISRHDILKKIVKGEGGKYSIPNYKLKKIKEILVSQGSE